MSSAWPWATLALLGAYHGLNPGMGWLFALSLGLQEKSQGAVVRALGPIALGHAAAIALTIFFLHFVQQILSPRILQLIVAAALFAVGFYRLFRARHPRGGGMRVGTKDLLLWSFLMASAHGAALMLAPILLAQPMFGITRAMHHAVSNMGAAGFGVLGLAVVVHTLALLFVAAILALLFYRSYERSGLRLLQRAWFNFDLLWAVALLVAGIAALLV